MTNPTQKHPLVFFIHIMKTGGFAMHMYLRQHLQDKKIYPPRRKGEDPKAESIFNYTSIDRIRALSENEKSKIDVLCGHLPYCVGELFDRELIRVSFFRNPVDRVLSHLRMFKSNDAMTKRPDLSLSDIYETEPMHTNWWQNFQCRYFAHTLTDDLKSVYSPLKLTRADMERAKERVHQCTLIGLLEDYERSFAKFANLLGMPFKKAPRGNASPHYEVPNSLRDRIAEDNVLDIEFYEYVRGIYEERLSAEERAEFRQRKAA